MSVDPLTPVAAIAALSALAALQITCIGAARAHDAAPADRSGLDTRANLSEARHSDGWKYLDASGALVGNAISRN